MLRKQYSRFDEIPRGHASNNITDGCIVLEGGAFRGVYGEGVLDALMLADINFQCVIGVSAGALNGMNYVAGNIGRSARVNLGHRHDSKYVGLRHYRKNGGIIGFDYAFKDLIKEEPFDEVRFYNPNRRFVAVCTNCNTGKAEFIETKSRHVIYKAIRASASIPFASQMVHLMDDVYLDGGCANKVPYQWAIDQGYQKIIVVRTRHKAFRKKPYSEFTKSAISKIYKAYPELGYALSTNDKMYNNQCDELNKLEDDGKVFVIAPSFHIPVGRFESNLEKLGALYQLGFDDTMRSIKGLQKYLDN